MKKYFDRIALFLVFTFVITFVPTKADVISHDDLFNSANELGKVFIESFYDNQESGWTSETIIENTIPVHSPTGELASFVLNFTTNDVKNGYVVLNVNSNRELEPVEWGFSGEHMVNNPTRAYVKFCYGSYYYIDNLDEILEESLERKANQFNNRTNKLLFKEGSELKLIHVRTGKEEILSRYDAELIADKILSLATIESEKISTSSNHYENNVPLLFAQPNSSIPGMRYNFKPITSDDFTSSIDENACQVVAGVNLLRYWHARRSVSNLLARGTYYGAFHALDKEIGRLPIISGNIAYYARKGMENYLTNNNLREAAGNHNVILPSFSWINNNIKNSNPIILGMLLHNKYGNHAVLVVGSGVNQWGEYFRICDGWVTSLSTFVKPNEYSGSDAWYFRW